MGSTDVIFANAFRLLLFRLARRFGPRLARFVYRRFLATEADRKQTVARLRALARLYGKRR